MTQHVPMDQVQSAGVRRHLPLLVLACAIAAAYFLGLHHYLSFASFIAHQDILKGFVADHLLLAVIGYVVTYFIVVALSIPGAGLLSILGGFLFGWLLSGSITIIAATLGAVAVFKIVRTSLGCAMAERAGPFMGKLCKGFERNAFNYLLFLRLVPAVPFCAVNAVAGLTRVDLKTFALATLIGIVPGAYAFAWLGRGLDSVIAAHKAEYAACIAAQGASSCHLHFSPHAFITKEMFIAFVALGLLALCPILFKKWRSPS